MAQLFKLRFCNGSGRPLPYPKQAAVVADFEGMKAAEAQKLANEYFLDVAEDELVDRGVPLSGVFVASLMLNGTQIRPGVTICRKHLVGQTLAVTVAGVELAFPLLAATPSKSSAATTPGKGRKRTGDGVERPTRKKRNRKPHQVHESLVSCAVCSSRPVQHKEMVTLDCSHSLCGGCMVLLLGCQCQVQDIWSPCQCLAVCPACSEPAARGRIAAVKPAGATGPKAWEIIQREPLCQCGKTKNPCLGLRGQELSEAKWCIQCPGRPAEVVDLSAITCECGLGLRQWGLPEEKRNLARWCKQCPGRPEEAVQKIWKKCACGRSDPQFGLPGERRGLARWCSNCPLKPPEAIDIVHKRCECGMRQPKFALPGEPRKNAKWCAECPLRPVSAIDLVSKMCDCGRVAVPRFGLPGWDRRKAKWCGTCPTRPKEAVDICCKRCECGLHNPTFGLPWDQKRRWCADCPSRPGHATKLYSQPCECGDRTAHYGLRGDEKPRWCTRCPGYHPDAVIFLGGRCECGKRKATHALPGSTKKPRWCAKCPSLPPTAVLCGKLRPTPLSIGVLTVANQPTQTAATAAAAPVPSSGSGATTQDELPLDLA